MLVRSWYYLHSLEEIRKYLWEYTAEQDPNSEQTPGHVLWMCEEISSFSKYSISKSAKAGRWVGWIFATLEAHPEWSLKKDIWTNKRSRDLRHQDVCLARDVPAWFRPFTQAYRFCIRRIRS